MQDFLYERLFLHVLYPKVMKGGTGEEGERLRENEGNTEKK